MLINVLFLSPHLGRRTFLDFPEEAVESPSKEGRDTGGSAFYDRLMSRRTKPKNEMTDQMQVSQLGLKMPIHALIFCKNNNKQSQLLLWQSPTQ